MINIRPAVIEDAVDLAQLVNIAGEGMPMEVWQGMTPEGGDVWATGAARAARETGGFSYRNATVAEIGGRVAGTLVAYETAGEEWDASVPAHFRPFIELENMAAGSYYLNILAAYSQYRGQGVGSALLDSFGAAAAGRQQSVIVGSGNAGARRLYHRFGFKEIASRPIVAGSVWAANHRECILMLKD